MRSNTNYSKLLKFIGTDGIEIDHSTNQFTFGLSSGTTGGKFVDGTDPLDAAYNSGDVGIGTSTPQATLDVSGTLYVDDDAEFNSIVEINEDLSVSGDIDMGGNLSANGTFYIDGLSTFNDDSQFDGEMTSTCLLYTSDAARRIERCRSRWSPYH